ncbi:MAG: hypothetical protein Q7R59_00605 [bacterium]|nr:hypothetical protein [bacterium]
MEYLKHEKLTEHHFERPDVLRRFEHLQRSAGLQEHGRERVNEALKAAVTHITQKHGLSGMHSGHIEEAVDYLFSPKYKGYTQFKPEEKKVIEQSFRSHFHGTPEMPETEEVT